MLMGYQGAYLALAKDYCLPKPVLCASSKLALNPLSMRFTEPTTGLDLDLKNHQEISPLIKKEKEAIEWTRKRYPEVFKNLSRYESQFINNEQK